jgi:hypothetical protein
MAALRDSSVRTALVFRSHQSRRPCCIRMAPHVRPTRIASHRIVVGHLVRRSAVLNACPTGWSARTPAIARGATVAPRQSSPGSTVTRVPAPWASLPSRAYKMRIVKRDTARAGCARRHPGPKEPVVRRTPTALPENAARRRRPRKCVSRSARSGAATTASKAIRVRTDIATERATFRRMGSVAPVASARAESTRSAFATCASL